MKKKEQIKGKKRTNKYEKKLSINGSFEDVINVIVKNIKPPKKSLKTKK